MTLKQAKREFYRKYLADLLAATGHNVSAAARIAGTDRWGIYRLCYRWGVAISEARGEYRRCA